MIQFFPYNAFSSGVGSNRIMILNNMILSTVSASKGGLVKTHRLARYISLKPSYMESKLGLYLWGLKAIHFLILCFLANLIKLIVPIGDSR